jgi:SH3-like domain-containing protein
LLLLAVRIRGRRSLSPIAAAALGSIALVALLGFAGLGQRTAAVSLGDATVRADPALKGEALERLPAGVLVEVIDRRDDWIRVRTGPGVEGWVDVSLVEEV